MNAWHQPRSNSYPDAHILRIASMGIDSSANQGILMTDPRNVAHDKKVQQEKKNHGEEIAPNAEHTPQPGMKPALKDEHDKQDEQA